MDSSNDAYAIFFVLFFLCDFLYKSICCGYPFELDRQVDAIQTGPTTFAFKMYTGCNLKTMELLNCALIGVCGVIRSNTVCFRDEKNIYMICILIWSYETYPLT